MTIEGCIGACQSSEYTLAGVDFAREYFCDNQFDHGGGPAPDADTGCNMVCTGNSAEICGGSNKLDLYTYQAPASTTTSSSTATSSSTMTTSTTSFTNTASSTTTTSSLSTTTPLHLQPVLVLRQLQRRLPLPRREFMVPLCTMRSQDKFANNEIATTNGLGAAITYESHLCSSTAKYPGPA